MPRPTGYFTRIGLVSLGLAAATLLLVALGPRLRPLGLAAFGPSGGGAPAGAQISLTFNRPVDRASVEAAFRLDPPVEGRFFWEDRTLLFQPDRLLGYNTAYRVIVGPTARDAQGNPVGRELGWDFTTRGPRIAAVQATASGGATIWLLEPGGEGRVLLEVPAGVSDLVAAPDGSALVFVEPRGPQRSALVYLSLEDGRSYPLVDDEGLSAAAPAWSPLGDLIAYERRSLVDGLLGAPRVWLAQPDATLLGPLLPSSEELFFAPRWSADGNRVAMLDVQTQGVAVYSFFSDELSRLDAQSGEGVAWLPDPPALVYSAADEGGAAPRLRVLALGDSAGRELDGGGGAALSPAVSPDGSQVAFVRRGPGEPGATIWLAPADGGPAQALSGAGEHQDTLPAWSPDGSQVVFVRTALSGALRSTAVVVDVASGAEQALLDDVVQVVWLP